MSRDWLILAVFILICFGAAGLGSWFTTPALDSWYADLRKPPWNPPNWVFAPVWTTLYLLMAVAAWLVWRKAGFAAGRVALALFAVQLVLNVAWSALFFGQQNPGAAFGDIVLLWLAIAATMAAFRPVSPAAAWLLAPYLVWVTFAGVLNLTIWRLNG
jgi:tryptophan-rich sensory protein